MTDNYNENPEKQDFPDLDKVITRFKTKGIVKAPEQQWVYDSIANWCVGKAVVDAGCGIGIGTYRLSQEALGTLGIDINPESISFAKQMYESPTLKFEVVDLLKETPRPLATADVVCCIEVIEHLKDYDQLLKGLKQFQDDKRRTVYFISSPNRNSEKIGKDHPNNEYHVREWTAGEFYAVLTKHFKNVVLYASDKPNVFDGSNLVDGNTDRTPLLAKCEWPI
jgi:2-polyprenyl-3-methyl-5-hydroxy-6-metoxy-1,4-benzoquinol methylase